MVLSKEQIEYIKKIIEQHFNSFIFKNIGASELNTEQIRELEASNMDIAKLQDNFRDAYILGKIEGNVGGEGQKYNNYADFQKDIFNRMKGLTQQDQFAIDHIKHNAGEYISNLKNNISNKIVGEILSENREAHFDILNEIVKPTFQQAIEESKNIQEIISDLRDKTQDFTTNFDRIVKTELAMAHNYGSVRAIGDRNRGKNNDDILVYIQIVDDSATCKFCRSFYIEDGRPKIYRLSEILKNGTNYGKKQVDWLPVIPPVHPNCRCKVLELLQGWTLNESGQLEFIHPDHHEKNNNLVNKKSIFHNNLDLKKSRPIIDQYNFLDIPILIEKKTGDILHWKDEHGNKGQTTMRYDYGYIINTKGLDGQEIDVFVGNQKKSNKVYIIKERYNGKIDQEKIMLGFDNKEDAKKAFLLHYCSTDFFDSMIEMDIHQFKKKYLPTLKSFPNGTQKAGYIKKNGKWIKK